MKTMKLCKSCDLLKPTSHYNLDRAKKSGLSAYCKGCKKVKNREWHLKNPEKCRANAKQWRLDNSKKHVKYMRQYMKPRRLKFYYSGTYGPLGEAIQKLNSVLKTNKQEK